MTTELTRDLIAAVREGRAVLFLGAGASLGASDEHGNTAPDAKELAETLAKDFLGDGYEGFDLRSVYDLACSERDVRTVQRRIYQLLYPLEPAAFHLLIPTFPWSGLATTNYDLIVEKAFAQAKSGLKLVPNVQDGDGATDRLTAGSILYVKLHGCITRHEEVHPPLVASTEQLISFKQGRNGQFDTFMEWAKTRTMIFCGYSFMDMNLRTLFDEVIKEGDNRPRHYVVNKGARTAEIGYWRDRRVIAIDESFEEFLVKLQGALTDSERLLGGIAVSQHQSTFTKFITTRATTESDELKRYLGSLIDHVTSEIPIGSADPKRFYSGFELGWGPYVADLDIRQPAVGEITREYVSGTRHSSRLPIILIKGHAGSGKTVALRRICYDAATTADKLCFYVGRQHKIVIERFNEIFELTNLPIFLFVDAVAEHRQELLELIALAAKRKTDLRVVATENYHTWNILCDELEPYVSNVFEMRYLSESNILRLLEKLEAHDSLGYLARLPADKRPDELKFVHGRQLLVALLEATHGAPLTEIIEQEYRSIFPEEARRIYLDICSLHRFGPPVRAGLISRIHDLSFEDFSKKLFEPLEAIVVLRRDDRSGDYVYEARHSYIAHELYTAVLTDQEDRFDNIIRIVTKLNPSFSYDQEVLKQIIRSENLRMTLNNPDKIRQVYDAAEASFGESSVICHQRGVFELGIAVAMGQIDTAEKWLDRAEDLAPYNRAIRHSLAELALKRSRVAESAEDREWWRQKAVERATALISKSTSPYPHHTLLKAAVDAVKDALQALDIAPTETATLRVGEAITHAEATLKKGRQAFPNEAVLLNEEGNLSTVLAQGERAEGAFEKAFERNPRSSLIAKRLARIKRARGSFDAAEEILRKGLEHNPGSAELHYDLAITIIDSAPDAAQRESETLLYHLRRSFTPRDNNLQAQFWYARQLSIAGRFEEARPLFRQLSEARVPFREKTQVRGILKDPSGDPIEKVGTVSMWRETWGFIDLADPRMRVFLPLSESNADLGEYISAGTVVRFKLGFAIRGPIAIEPLI